MSTTQKTLVIAEAGVNHNGDLQCAKNLVDAAKEAGADVVKFQTFQATQLATRQAAQAEYQKKSFNQPQGQLAMLQRLELKPDQHFELIEYCNQRGIEFLSTAFDLTSIALLTTLDLKRWKIPSGEITNLPYLREIGGLGESVILSTGMANLGEIEAALDVLEHAGTPRSQITVLHCTTEYPAIPGDVNLRAMQTIAHSFGVDVGYSDHTEGISVPIAAVAMGASVIEKHITLDCNLPGPDHKASLEPDQFAAMVRGIRIIELALGNGLKRATQSEKKNMVLARKSLVAKNVIAVGDIFTIENLTAKRPGCGVSPMKWDEYIGKKAIKCYQINDLIDE